MLVPPALLLSDRPELPAAVRRLAAVAGVPVELVAPPAWRTGWHRSGLLMLDDLLVPVVGRHRPPRRPRLVVVSLGGPGPESYRLALELGAEQLLVLPGDERALLERLGEAERLPGAGRADHRPVVIGVVGGCGGAGASTLAAGLALTAAARDQAALVDLDPRSGGVDVLLGLEQMTGTRWGDLHRQEGADTHRWHAGLLRHGRLGVVSGDRAPAAPLAASTVQRGLDTVCDTAAVVVLDLPRRLDDAAAVGLTRCDVALLVLPATVPAAAAGGVVLGEIRPIVGRTALVVRDPASGQLRPGQVADALGAPLLATYDSEPAIRSAAVHGRLPPVVGRGSLAAACRQLLRQLTTQPEPV